MGLEFILFGENSIVVNIYLALVLYSCLTLYKSWDRIEHPFNTAQDRNNKMLTLMMTCLMAVFGIIAIREIDLIYVLLGLEGLAMCILCLMLLSNIWRKNVIVITMIANSLSILLLIGVTVAIYYHCLDTRLDKIGHMTEPGIIAYVIILFLLLAFSIKLLIFPALYINADLNDSVSWWVMNIINVPVKYVYLIVFTKLVNVAIRLANLEDVVIVLTGLAIINIIAAVVYGMFTATLRRFFAVTGALQMSLYMFLLSSTYYFGEKQAMDERCDYSGEFLYLLLYFGIMLILFRGMVLHPQQERLLYMYQIRFKEGNLFYKTTLILIVFSLAGLPFSGGFLQKLILYKSLSQAGLWMTLVVAAVTSAISILVYIRILVESDFSSGKPKEIADTWSSGKLLFFASVVVGVWLAPFAALLYLLTESSGGSVFTPLAVFLLGKQIIALAKEKLTRKYLPRSKSVTWRSLLKVTVGMMMIGAVVLPLCAAAIKYVTGATVWFWGVVNLLPVTASVWQTVIQGYIWVEYSRVHVDIIIYETRR